MQLPKWATVLLAVALNTLHALIAFQAVHAGSPAFIAVNVALAVVNNLAALFGLPLPTQAQQTIAKVTLLAISLGASGYLLVACAHMTAAQKQYLSAYGQCMKDKGLAEVPSVMADVGQALDGALSQAQGLAALEGLAGKAGIDAVTCAVEAWLHPYPAAADGGAKLAAEPPSNNLNGIRAAVSWLAMTAHGPQAHPAALHTPLLQTPTVDEL